MLSVIKSYLMKKVYQSRIKETGIFRICQDLSGHAHLVLRRFLIIFIGAGEFIPDFTF